MDLNYQPQYPESLFNHDDFTNSGAVNGQVEFSPRMTVGDHDLMSQPPGHVPTNDGLYSGRNDALAEAVVLLKRVVDMQMLGNDKAEQRDESIRTKLLDCVKCLAELKRGQEEMTRRQEESEREQEEVKRRQEEVKRGQEAATEELKRGQEDVKREQKEVRRGLGELKRAQEQIWKLLIDFQNAGRQVSYASSRPSRPRSDYSSRNPEPVFLDPPRPPQLRDILTYAGESGDEEGRVSACTVLSICSS
ncbi:trichohyalin [Alternaria alternata]|nr:trichohyalin [Alternaria alternata]OWY49390.1 trichohyalin [Alternaria alternata]